MEDNKKEIEQLSRREVFKMTQETKRKKRSKRANILLTLLTVGIIGGIAIEGINLLSIYNSSKAWQKQSKTPIASLEPYMLYLSQEDMDNLSEYTSRLSVVYDSNKGVFADGITQNDLDELKKEFDKLAPSLKEKEEAKYKLVSNMWSMKADYDAMWNKEHTALLDSTTPKTVSDYVDKHWKIMDSYLEDDTIQKEWLINTYNELFKLRDDTATISALFNMFNSTFDVSDKKIIVKKDVASSAISEWSTTKAKLNFSWPIVSTYMTEIINNSSKILEKHDKAINLYSEYSEAAGNKNAFDSWNSKYTQYNNSMITLPDFVGKDVETVKAWAKENGITLIVNKVEDSAKKDTVISQIPTTYDYSKIMKGSSFTVNVAKEKATTSESKKKEEKKETTEATTKENN
jgi:PASTA domain